MTTISFSCATDAGLAGLALRMAGQLGVIVDGLRSAVAARAGRDRAVVPVAVLLWNRMARLMRCFDALAARVAAGRTATPPRVTGVRAEPGQVPATARPRLPRGHGWLTRLMVETNAARSQLEHLLHDPEMAALLAAEPAAVRMLRPLCRMLMIEMPAVGMQSTKAGMPDDAMPEAVVVAAAPAERGIPWAVPAGRPAWRGS